MAKELSAFEELDKLIKKEFEEAVDLSKIDNSVKNFYSLGNYALNYLATKNIHGAIASGRVTDINGESGTGKSLFVSATAADPQIDMVLIVETEGGGSSKELFEFAGVNPIKVRMLKANTFESYRINKKTGKIEEINDADIPKKLETDEYSYKEGATRLLKKFVQAYEMNKLSANVLVILDSLGNIQTVRELSGGSKDMGLKNQEIAKFFRTFDLQFERTNIAFVFTNKVYTNIMNQYDPLKESGGVNVEYNPSLTIRLQEVSNSNSLDLSTSDIDDEKDRRKTALGNSMKTITAIIKKSRFGTEGRRLNILIDTAVGPLKFSGLFELCKDFGLIEKAGSMYSMPTIFEKSFYKKDFVSMVRKDEEKIINKIQEELTKIELKIKQEKMEYRVEASEENLEKASEDKIEDYSDMMEEISKGTA